MRAEVALVEAIDGWLAPDEIELLLELRRRRGATLVLVTHDEALARHADRVVVLRDGRVKNGAA